MDGWSMKRTCLIEKGISSEFYVFVRGNVIVVVLPHEPCLALTT